MNKYNSGCPFNKNPDESNSRGLVIPDITRRTKKTNPAAPTLNLTDAQGLMTIANDERIRKFNFNSTIIDIDAYLTDKLREKIVATRDDAFFCFYMSQEQITLFESFPTQVLIDGKRRVFFEEMQ